jgi:glycosyltransferase involved in cell wall biosynthesis
VVLSNERYTLELSDINLLNQIFESVKINKVIYNNAVASSDPLGIIELIINLKTKYNFELVTLFHDFYPICPSYTLLNKDGRYCGVPQDMSICRQCLPKVPARFSAFIQPGMDIERWRLIWKRMLSCSDGITCFSENSREIVLKAYPTVAEKIKVVPHAVSWDESNMPHINYDAPLHIGIVGKINYAKGLDVVLGLVQAIQERKKNIKITVLGEVDAVTPIKGLTVTGGFKKDDLPKLIEELGINLFLFPSVCPETFSYVVAELILMNVPLACFDIGAPADRIRNYSKGKVLSLDTDSSAILEILLAFHESNACASL